MVCTLRNTFDENFSIDLKYNSLCPNYTDFIFELSDSQLYSDFLIGFLQKFKNVENPALVVDLTHKDPNYEITNGIDDNELSSLKINKDRLETDNLIIEIINTDIETHFIDLKYFAYEDCQSDSRLEHELNIIDCLRMMVNSIKKENNLLPVFYSLNNRCKLVGSINEPIFVENSKVVKKVKKQEKLEKDLEQELYDWISLNGVICEKQVVMGGYRSDIWIPGVCFLELKRGKVTSKDFCQALRYNVETNRKIILVGSNIEKDVMSTITAYNEMSNADVICFLSWETVKVYLRGLLGF